MTSSATSTKYCQHEGCDKTFERDPALEVQCPSCDAEPGDLCRRPSGHVVWNKQWSGLPKGIHPERDVEALRQGVYGSCPLGRCPESVSDLPQDNPYSPRPESATTEPTCSDAATEQPALDEF